MAPSPNDALVAQLVSLSTQNKRIANLKDREFVFDFVNSTHTSDGDGGFITVTNPSMFPALITGNAAIAVGMIGPCGLNTPHIHPRASEIQINIGGGDLKAEFILENEGRVVENILSPGMATVFPKGSIHFQQNLGCNPVTFVASFDFVDAGVSQVVSNLLMLDKEVLSATFNNVGLKYLNKLVVPPNIALGAQSCFDRCKIDRSKFKFDGTFADFFDSTQHLNTPLTSASPYQAMTGVQSSASGILSKSICRIPFNPFTVMGLGGALIVVIMIAAAARAMPGIRRRG